MAIIENPVDPSFGPAYERYLVQLSQKFPQIPGQAWVQAAHSLWDGQLGGGSNPYSAAWQTARKVSGMDPQAFQDMVPYDQASSDTEQAQAVANSPEGRARANDSGGMFGGYGGLLGAAAGAGLAYMTGGASLALGAGLGSAAGTKLDGGSWGDAARNGVLAGGATWAGGQLMGGAGTGGIDPSYAAGGPTGNALYGGMGGGEGINPAYMSGGDYGNSLYGGMGGGIGDAGGGYAGTQPGGTEGWFGGGTAGGLGAAGASAAGSGLGGLAGTAASSLGLGGLGTLAGAGLGALLGSQNGSKPAGTTTTIQDIPAWQRPYVMSGFNEAQNVYDANKGKYDSLNGQASNFMGQTVNGDFLNSNPGNTAYQGLSTFQNPYLSQLQPTASGDFLNANPYLDAMISNGQDRLANKVNSQFTSSGRYGSGAQTGELGYQLGNYDTQLRGQNYSNERQLMQQAQNAMVTGANNQAQIQGVGAAGLSSNYNSAAGRQLTAGMGVPDFTGQQQTNAFAPVTALNGIFGRSFGNQTTQPYFANQAGGILSGAATGAGIARLLA